MGRRPTYQYFEVIKDRQEYMGERYFRLDFNSDTVLQVCITPSETQGRGRSNNIGLYLISRQTFLANYLGMSYTQTCTKQKFYAKAQKVIKWIL